MPAALKRQRTAACPNVTNYASLRTALACVLQLRFATHL